MRGTQVFALAMVLVFTGGCGDSGASSGSSGGSGGTTTTSTGGTGGVGGTGGSTATGGGETTATGGGGTGGTSSTGSGGLMCPEQDNPMFGSCVEGFLQGCYEPDLDGTCTEEGGNVTWSDGSKYVTNGDYPGLYGPGDAAPCITVTFDQTTITAVKGADTLVYESDQATGTATVTCPDGSQFTATFEQVTTFNRCVGVNCP